ncbi:MAG TPA: phosphatidylcholine--retinol O-acyltransferase, partial [Acinetobacter radioresistens]|nr:phosphatidylcholine--retinol O-acyltransferase [Acinetobacter radioresistens]
MTAYTNFRYNPDPAFNKVIPTIYW